MSKKESFRFIIAIGFMLFALFFGAGNLIFPVMLGQSAGTEIWSANAGFVITGVGLPLLGVLALGFSGKSDLKSLASRAHPIFGLIFTTILYLAIGPLFAIPRTGSVSFEIGVKPFLPTHVSFIPLLVFTVLFFGVTCYFSLNTSKIVDIVGRILTPLLLIFIGILIVTAVIHPMGKLSIPTEHYVNHSFFKGFQDGYLTMDTLAAFVFGIIVLQAIKDKGISGKGKIMSTCLKAGLIAAGLLVVIYTALSFIGASSVKELGILNNGATILAGVSNHYFSQYGRILLGFIVIAACLTTSIGLISSSATYFHKMFPRISYKIFTIILSVISTIFANVGLMRLISISEPILVAIYPLAICLIFLTFFHSLFKGKSEVYICSLLFTFLVSFFDGLKAAKIKFYAVDQLFTNIFPLYSVGMGWLLPAIIGGIIGYIISILKKKEK
ncbi:branched-chain amino acid transport system II carrier protein [Heyndrickxia sporothermodurans]|uniref:branched-chain amino acid transport system II carrier protein n=1 Tax=Heyndrickxia sporothermodurans TaxID=46224 RepID=UPI002DB9BEBD|nr:branched-chain amino acid transport system II carrier protein [Heyndrickxia sporothermodurans]MEB6550933.1 branched-chain amino acid transport system II carrier protein [Heyndrickxia sporothermodurans]MED3651150.1 branched-chain amino acid transport system II carrier protein [Heyndrickxia sporothermodurans]MED3655520.1 branched-chain amino acid transport system II carrier protein [Heyndrickxia sporothermodurans]MED3698775.1 branched-chain amino acid transport system II carrier protein [Heynd